MNLGPGTDFCGHWRFVFRSCWLRVQLTKLFYCIVLCYRLRLYIISHRECANSVWNRGGGAFWKVVRLTVLPIDTASWPSFPLLWPLPFMQCRIARSSQGVGKKRVHFDLWPACSFGNIDQIGTKFDTNHQSRLINSEHRGIIFESNWENIVAPASEFTITVKR